MIFKIIFSDSFTTEKVQLNGLKGSDVGYCIH